MGNQISEMLNTVSTAAEPLSAQALEDLAVNKAHAAANYYASRGADGRAALESFVKRTELDGVRLPAGWQAGIPLHGAAMNGHVAELAFLVDTCHAKLDAPEAGSADPPIHVAVAWGRPACVAYLLARGASAQALDGEGLTPLQAARRRLRLLEERGDEAGLVEGGTALVELLEGVEARGSYSIYGQETKLPSYSDLSLVAAAC